MTKNIRFRIVDGDDYWCKYEEFVRLYNEGDLTVNEIFNKLKMTNRRFDNYRKRGFSENRLKSRRQIKK